MKEIKMIITMDEFLTLIVRLKEVKVIITAIITCRIKSKNGHLESCEIDHILPLELADGAVFVAEPMLSYLIFVSIKNN